MNEFPSQGLLNLTRTILEQIFSEDKAAKLTDEHMEVLSGIVLHHLAYLPDEECAVLTQLYGVSGIEPKPLGVIRAEHGWTKTQAQKYVDKAFQDLIDVAKSDLYITMYDIEHSDKEQS